MESQDAVAPSIAPDEACASAVKDAKLLIDEARNPAGKEIVEDHPVPLTDGGDGTLAEVTDVVQRRTYRRLTDFQARILYQMLKRREREIQLQIEGGLAHPLPTGPEVVNEAHTPITFLKNAENVASFDTNAIHIPSSLEMDVEEVAVVETPLTNEAPYCEGREEEIEAGETHRSINTNKVSDIPSYQEEVAARELAALETPVTNKASFSQVHVEEASTRETHLTDNPSSSRVYVDEASAGDTHPTSNANHFIDIPSSPEMDVEEVVALETPVTNKASSFPVYAEEASTRATHLTDNQSSSKVYVDEASTRVTHVTDNPSSSQAYLEETLTKETHLTDNPTSSKLYVEEGSPSETPMTKDASSSRAVRYNLRKRGPNARKYKENEGSRSVGRRKIIKWSKHEEATLRAGVKRVGEGSWKAIFNLYRNTFVNRTSVDLKDKWRVITGDKAKHTLI